LATSELILVTGATGKVGQAFLSRFFDDSRFSNFSVRALLHNRQLAPHDRLQTLHGSISDDQVVNQAMEGVTHVLHLATVKETPHEIMDIAVKGMFWLLEAARSSPTFKQFILIGGDAGMGHFFYPHPIPVTETQRHSAYKGCYALSKVLEEVMLEQYYIQYGLNGCCLRAPWIMEKDDFKYTLSFGEDVFGGPRWRDLVGADKADEYVQTNAVPVMLDAKGQAIKRNFVHVDDLVDSIFASLNNSAAKQQTFNICMDEPVDYQEVGNYLSRAYGCHPVDIVTEYASTWLDNAKAKFLLGWRPKYDLKALIDAAWTYKRSEADPRKVWYPG
jgi:UDP-glucose 4-epimerase